MCSQSDTCCPIFTWCCLSVRKAVIQETINSGRWYIVLSLVISMVWSMWLNELLKSKSRFLSYYFSLQSSVALLQWRYSSTRAWSRTASLTAILGWVHIYTNIVPNPLHHKGLLDFTYYKGERYWAQIFFQSLRGFHFRQWYHISRFHEWLDIYA